MPKASELKRGMVLDINDEPHIVKTIDCQSPSSRGAQTLYKIRLTNARTKQKRDESWKADEFLKEADFMRRRGQYLFNDGEFYTFMDLEDYAQYALSPDDLGDDVGYMLDGLEGIMMLIVDDNVIGIEMPASVNLEITDTSPGIKGASASARTKAATLSTGIEVQVPEYLETGEVIKVNTSNGKYMSRA